MAAPPVEAGAVHDTTEEVLAYEVAFTLVGTPGTAAGVAGAEAAEVVDVPAGLVAFTVKVYDVPLVRPVTVQLVVTEGHVTPPGDEVTVYPVMAAPPLDAGAVHDTTDWVLALDVAVTPVGALGTAAGMAGAEAAEAGPVPAELVAVTVKV